MEGVTQSAFLLRANDRVELGTTKDNFIWWLDWDVSPEHRNALDHAASGASAEHYFVG